jgi:hypothetical protein
VSGAVTGSGVGRPGAQVEWSVAGRIVRLGAHPALRGHHGVDRLLGNGPVGPIAVTVILGISCFLLWRANMASKVSPDDVLTTRTPTFEAVRA